MRPCRLIKRIGQQPTSPGRKALTRMPDRLEYYREQHRLALEHAQRENVDRAGWLRIAEEWQKLIEAQSRELGQVPPENPTVLES